MSARRIALCALVVAPLFAYAAPLRAQLTQVPNDIPEPTRSELVSRRNELRNSGQLINEAMASFNARCASVTQAEPSYTACSLEKTELDSGYNRMLELFNAFNLDVEAAARIALVATTLTFTNIQITGDVQFAGPDGQPISATDVTQMRIPPGTTIVTGPGGSFAASVPGGHSFQVGGGSELAIDSVFMNPSSLQTLAVDLKHGFFRWLKVLEQSVGIGRFRVRTPTVAVAVRGTDVDFRFSPDGAGRVRLHSGEVTLQSLTTQAEVTLLPGQMVDISPEGSVADPVPIPDSDPR